MLVSFCVIVFLFHSSLGFLVFKQLGYSIWSRLLVIILAGSKIILTITYSLISDPSGLLRTLLLGRRYAPACD